MMPYFEVILDSVEIGVKQPVAVRELADRIKKALGEHYAKRQKEYEHLY